MYRRNILLRFMPEDESGTFLWKEGFFLEINLKVLTYHTILNFFGFAAQNLNISKGIQLVNTTIGTIVRKAHINK